MSTTISSDGLSPRKKRALYQAWHRGTKEMDLLLGQFADAALATMSEAEMDAFEAILNETDRDLFSWVVGSEPAGSSGETTVFKQFLAFHAGKKGTAA
ncbi:MAG: succinate dehydrogenase assembly factor 2 [Ancalomicrobiaceae bacterium]|nr:succinate dehydrogenase assembly factor 2 [Ancalomicrobiaceae bacterium]